jgi:spore maturation protein CgeB
MRAQRMVTAQLKQIPFMFQVNAALKARLLESRRSRLLDHYAALSSLEVDAIAMMRRRLIERGVDLRARELGDLNLFWIGANKEQDNSGLLQGLRRFGDVEEFVSADGSYGPRYPLHRTIEPRVVAENDASLVRQIQIAQARRPLDAVLGQVWRYLFSEESLGRIQALGIPVLNISMDDRLPELWMRRSGLRLGAVGLGGVTDLVLTTSPETCRWYAFEGVPAVFFPLGSDPDLFRPSGENLYDILFVGSRYGYRERLVAALQQEGLPIHVYGPGWPLGPLESREVAGAFSSARIVLGVGTVGYSTNVYTLKLRDFDGPMSGALYLTHRNPDLLSLYREDEEIVCYDSTEECVRKVRYYLSHETERVRVAAGGLSRARSDYTWSVRFTDLFKRIGLLAHN